MAKHIPHIFISDNQINDLQLSDDSFHHLIKVLRFKVGNNFVLLDNQGLKADCKITTIDKNKLSFEITDKQIFSKNENNLNLFQAITKIETFEEILDKATQLGINQITPVISENVNVSMDIFNKKYPRFNKILTSAAEQSQRVFLPVLNKPITLENFYNNVTDNTFIAYEKATIPLKKYLRDFKADEINIFCGPEGGITDKEAELLSSKFKTFSLGSNILRAETAVITTISNFIYELDLFL